MILGEPPEPDYQTIMVLFIELTASPEKQDERTIGDILAGRSPVDKARGCRIFRAWQSRISRAITRLKTAR